MKVLVLSYEFPPLGGGGAQVVYGLTKEMARLGHEVDIVSRLKDLVKLIN
jgi:glycosyltransferase involved in cell wall biosynthesis